MYIPSTLFFRLCCVNEFNFLFYWLVFFFSFIAELCHFWFCVSVFVAKRLPVDILIDRALYSCHVCLRHTDQWDEYLLSILSDGTAHWIASHQSDPNYNQERLKSFLKDRYGALHCCVVGDVTCVRRVMQLRAFLLHICAHIWFLVSDVSTAARNGLW